MGNEVFPYSSKYPRKHENRLKVSAGSSCSLLHVSLTHVIFPSESYGGNNTTIRCVSRCQKSFKAFQESVSYHVTIVSDGHDCFLTQRWVVLSGSKTEHLTTSVTLAIFYWMRSGLHRPDALRQVFYYQTGWSLHLQIHLSVEKDITKTITPSLQRFASMRLLLSTNLCNYPLCHLTL